MTDVELATPGTHATERFAGVLEAVRKRVKKDQYTTWFQRTCLVAWEGNELVVGLPNRFYQQWFHKHFRGLVRQAAEEIAKAPTEVRFVIDACKSSTAPAEPADEAAPVADDEPAASAAAAPSSKPTPFTGSGPDDLPLQLHEHYTFQNFIVGPSNRVACASARAVAQDPGRAYNPLFLHGSVGLGKTHLLHAICHEFVTQCPSERICFLSCEEFTNEFVQALQRHDLERFRARFRNVHLLVIDDIHFLVGKERIQDEFFHTFNRLYQSHRQIVISSDAPPAEIPTLQDRLVSRFKWGLVANIDQPEMETRMAIVRRKAELLDIEVPGEVVEFIAQNFRSNIRELEGALLSVSARAGVLGVPMDIEVAQTALEPSLAKDQPSLTLDHITEVVAAQFQVKISDLRSKRRSRSISVPRQVVMYLARQATDLSFEEIGAHFGGRDHSTVIYAVRKVEGQVASDSRFAAQVDRLRDRLGLR